MRKNHLLAKDNSQINKNSFLINRYLVNGLGIFLFTFLSACSSGSSGPTLLQPEEGENYSGGEATHFDSTDAAFDRRAPNLTTEQAGTFELGDTAFNASWTAGGTGSPDRDGLGPLFNTTSCFGCHENDGRGRPPEPGEQPVSLLFRLSIPASPDYVPHGHAKNSRRVFLNQHLLRLLGNISASHDGLQAAADSNEVFDTLPDPNYGGQLNGSGIDGVDGEADLTISYEEIPGTYADGTVYSLRKPTYTFTNHAYGAFDSNILISPRTAPHMAGMGLLEAITEADILAKADPNDDNNDGISGRVNYVYDKTHDEMRIGRFGWKANQPSLRQQVAGAFNGDIGITSSLFPDENYTDTQTALHALPNGGTPELSDTVLDRVIFYCQGLGVPGRRNYRDQSVLRGKQLFNEFGCAQCHTPSYTTGTHDIEALSNQKIYPYTDLLVHDMGDELADGRPDGQAGTHEWRTPPLWGIGLFDTVNDHTLLMHDGRARGFAEAILWHGGEGEDSKEAFRTATAQERADLIAFLESL